MTEGTGTLPSLSHRKAPQGAAGGSAVLLAGLQMNGKQRCLRFLSPSPKKQPRWNSLTPSTQRFAQPGHVFLLQFPSRGLEEEPRGPPSSSSRLEAEKSLCWAADVGSKHLHTADEWFQHFGTKAFKKWIPNVGEEGRRWSRKAIPATENKGNSSAPVTTLESFSLNELSTPVANSDPPGAICLLLSCANKPIYIAAM